MAVKVNETLRQNLVVHNALGLNSCADLYKFEQRTNVAFCMRKCTKVQLLKQQFCFLCKGIFAATATDLMK